MKKHHHKDGKSQTVDIQKPANIYQVQSEDTERHSHAERQMTECQTVINAKDAEQPAMIRELLAKSEPLQMPKPEPSLTPEPEPLQTSEPEPSLTSEPEPSLTSEPEPLQTSEPEPSLTPEPEPLQASEPEPLQASEPEPSLTPEEIPTEEAAESAEIPAAVSFTESLEKLTPDGIAPPPPKKKIPLSELVGECIRKLMLVGCLCVFGYSTFMLIQNIVDKQRGQDIYGDISSNIFESDLYTHAVSLMSASRSSVGLPDYYTSLTANADELAEYAEPKAYNQTFERMKSNIAALTAQNTDTFGYIRIDGTNISYPIMQSGDNDYYLDHAYTGDPLIIGSIFADFRAYRYMDWNYNTVFYGHNIIDGSMFNNVTLFFDKEVFNSKLIEIYTPEAIYYYKPFAIFQAQATYQYFEMYFATGEDFVNFCYEMQERSSINNHETFTEDDRIITLSTCVNDPAGLYRYALQAKLVKVEN